MQSTPLPKITYGELTSARWRNNSIPKNTLFCTYYPTAPSCIYIRCKLNADTKLLHADSYKESPKKTHNIKQTHTKSSRT